VNCDLSIFTPLQSSNVNDNIKMHRLPQPVARMVLWQATASKSSAASSVATAFAGGAPLASTLHSLHSLAVGVTYAMDRSFKQGDIDAYTALTGDSNPIHTSSSTSTTTTISNSSNSNSSSSNSTAADEPIVPGMLLASLFPAIIGSSFGGALYATQSLAFRSACAVDEPVRAEVTVARASGRRVRFDTVCRAVRDGRTLVDGVALAVIKQRQPPA